MRVIKFRGFHADEHGETVIKLDGKEIRGRWYKGDLSTDSGYYIQEHAVIPETVGQYVYDDENGKEVFEGDIVLNNYILTHSEEKQTKEQRIGVIVYDKCEFRADTYVNGKMDGAFWIKHIWKGDSIEVIGNIFENPDLEVEG